MTDGDIDEICPICHDNYDETNHQTKLECDHNFHTTCIIKWFRTPTNEGACPMCRGRPEKGMTRMNIRQRCTYLRRRARAKLAPVALKRRVEKTTHNRTCH